MKVKPSVKPICSKCESSKDMAKSWSFALTLSTNRDRVNLGGNYYMARIVGVDIPNDKPVGIALTYIYGIGRYTAELICEKAKVDFAIRVKDLTDDQLGAVRNAISHFKNEGDLRREVALNIKRLSEIGAIVAFAIEEAYQFAVKEQRPMLVLQRSTQNHR